VKFLVDMPLSPGLADWLAAAGHDAVHAMAIDLGRASDADTIAKAAADFRVIITADLDYPRLLALTRTAGPGLILFRGGDWRGAEVVARMGEILAVMSENDLSTSILVVDRNRVRRRRLPLR
jgi:predicted nuclease of predicted toxin-antitoxin system